MLLALVAAALLVGQSVQDRPIAAVRTGDADAPNVVLAVGDIHGNERAGRAVIRQLRKSTPPADTQVWTVMSANPDGEAANTRQNARGVDLNRNWGYRWQKNGIPFSTYYPGRRAWSEPESRAMRDLIERIHPNVTVWFHQHLALVDLVPRADQDVIERYAKQVGLPAVRLPSYHGSATRWQNVTYRRDSAFVVELPAGALSHADAVRHAQAVMNTVKPVAGAAQAGPGDGTVTPTPTATPKPTVTPTATPDETTTAPKPHIVKSFIPFPRKRKREMAAYSERHYGDHTYKLTDVKTIVEHYTASTSYASAYNTFADDVPDSELHELPATCAHFIVDTDGTIHQLVPLTIRCRHTVGLNDRSIGIEHVGTSDAQVLGDKQQLRASLKLTRWLQSVYDVPTKYVIGHAESLSSPFHHEKVKALRHQTHGDFPTSAMNVYRRKL